MISKNDWNDRFLAGALSAAEPLVAVRRALELLPAGDMLDLACGPGRHTILAARAGWRVTAVDSSEEALRQLRAACPGAKLVQADLEQSGVRLGTRRWDLIVQTLYLNRRLFVPIAEALRPGGIYCAAFLRKGRFAIEPEEVLAAFPSWETIEVPGDGAALDSQVSGGRHAASFEILLRKPE